MFKVTPVMAVLVIEKLKVMFSLMMKRRKCKNRKMVDTMKSLVHSNPELKIAAFGHNLFVFNYFASFCILLLKCFLL